MSGDSGKYGFLTPDQVNQYIAYNADNKNWEYSNAENSMAGKQCEGVAYLWNIIEKFGLALLADEVGTGKTYQALGVLVTLLRLKPDARCLIIAPRENVAMNWLNEYDNFIHFHYKLEDDRIKSSVTQRAIPKMEYCRNLDALVEKSNQFKAQIFLAKTTMFSNIRNTKSYLSNTDGSESEKGENGNQTILKEVFESSLSYSYALKNKFDLLIIDEAHYYRNFDYNSQRVTAAKGFFGYSKEDTLEKGKPISSRILLLTATPNHSGKNNIFSMVRYFNYLNLPEDPEEILNKLCLRRFRRLEKLTKYNYREERALPASFAEDVKSETFFAVYQKNLIRKLLESPSSGSGGNDTTKGRMFFGYLEGCEFVCEEHDEQNADETRSNGEGEDAIDETKRQDYTKGYDHEVLGEVVRRYLDIFQEPPAHPKYDCLIDETMNKTDDKQLIFVRRIASVREIKRRLLKEYDKRLFGQLKEVLTEIKASEQPKRREDLDNLVKNIGGVKEDTGKEVDTDEGNLEELSNDTCLMLDYFVTKKDGAYRATEGSRFRNKLANDESSPFSMLFELPPQKNRLEEPYKEIVIYRNKDGQKKFPDSAKVARYRYYKHLKDNNVFKNQSPSGKEEEERYLTIWNLFFKFEDPAIQKSIEKMDEYEWEGLGTFTKQALLFASDAIIELFGWSRKADNYADYCKKLEKQFKESRTRKLMREAVSHYKYLWMRCFSMRKEDLPEKKFRLFYNATPVYGYHGGTKNENIIKLFNTPFYPNTIVATSVLQEGVNLHYFCDNIIHYGIAWTPGDNEQRNGRVDRFFGKIHRKLKKKADGVIMPIEYPFIKDTVDESQLSHFICNKKREEVLIDKCLNMKSEKKFNPGNDSGSKDWESSLLSPEIGRKVDDPYPYIPESNGIAVKFPGNTVSKGEEIVESILRTLGQIENVDMDKRWSKTNRMSLLCNCDVKFDIRHQPVAISCDYLPAIDSSNDYLGYFYLSLISPLEKERNWGKEFTKAYGQFLDLIKDNPILSLVVDREKNGYEYLSCRTDVLVSFTNDRVFLDRNEIENALLTIAKVTDEMEKILRSKDIACLQDAFNGKNEKTQVYSKELENNDGNQIFPDSWEISRNEKFVFLRSQIALGKELDFKNFIDIASVLNEYPFFSWYVEGQDFNLRLAYLKNNFQTEERLILENWHKLVANELIEKVKELVGRPAYL